ncbi:hypothetical protein HK097_003130 [Rhizophlyctis rosea]|uniref:SH3 domain-containing protein n=1 Tax=Rhizophlyctis rosea TaxID=64517 RepID=A0AAD5SGS0_9FUNG|nr:hypothetical protein HK097_003130 [Rhizophlyctis rosea]
MAAAKEALTKTRDVTTAALSKINLHNPIPQALEDEFKKVADVLDHFIKGNNQMDSALIPSKVIANAKGVAVLTIIKAGFVWSGRAGSGIVVARLPDGKWSAPSAIAAAGVGFGGQIGAQITDCVFILNNDDAVKAFAHGGNITLGGNLSVAAGPKGRSAEAAGAVMNLAPIYSYSKSKGLFAGVSLEGSVILTRSDANKELYGRKIDASELLSGKIPPPHQAEALYRVLNYKFANMGTGLVQQTPYAKSVDLKRSASDGSAAAGWGSRNRVAAQSAGATRSNTLGQQKPAMSTPSVASPLSAASAKPPPVPPKKIPVVTATALFNYTAERDTDLSFKKGDTIVVTKQGGAEEWWRGRVNDGPEGEFPGNYCRVNV